MSELPSRDHKHLLMEVDIHADDLGPSAAIVRAYISGRLFDRKALDYENGWGYLRAESARPIDSEELVWIDKVDFMAAVVRTIGNTDA